MDSQMSKGFAAALAVATLLQGCGGGGNGGGSGVAATPLAAAPTLSGLADLSFDQDTASPALAFRIDDADTPVAQLELALATSDANLLPLHGLRVEGSGNERTLRVSPAAESTGMATVTITVRDPGGLTASRTLGVRVNPVLVAFSGVARRAFDSDAGGGGDPAKVAGVTIQPDVDDDPAAFDALLQSGSP